jgi:hypothetical protein
LEEGAKEYDNVKDALRDLTQGHETIITPNFMIQGGWQANPSTYNLPEDIKAQYKNPEKKHWRVKKVLNIGG